MSASQDINTAKSVSNQEGEVGSHVAPSVQHAKQTTHGHQPGREPGPEEFHLQTQPAGTAPASRTFGPQPEGEVPGQANNPDSTTATDPLDFPGATSKDVHTGLGHPGQGQSSKELRHDGQAVGLTGRGAEVGGFDQPAAVNKGQRVPLDGVDK